jgi:hypothetical protein
MKYTVGFLAALTTVWLGVGCGGGDDTGPTDTGPTCTPIAACGGTLTGDWKINSFCPDTKVPQAAKDICETATVDYGTPTVSGTISFKDDKSFTIQATANGTGALVLDKSCLEQGSTTLTCAQIQQAIESNTGTMTSCTASNGGCRCAGTVMGSNTETGTYAISGNSVTLTTSGGSLSSDFCEKGDNNLYLTLNLNGTTDAGAALALAGQLVLSK